MRDKIYIEILQGLEETLGRKIEIDKKQNILELGVTSLQIMRLANRWRKKGKKISFMNLISKPYLEEWEKLFDCVEEVKEAEIRKQDNELQENVEFPLTKVQYAYWIGRQKHQTLGNIGCHGYLEIDGQATNPEKLEKAWNVIRKYHPMLRAAFTKEGNQKILPYVEKKIKINDMKNFSEEECEKRLLSIRNELSHRLLKIEEGEVADISLSLLPNDKTRIHFDIDLLIADVQSFQIILRDLAKAYLYDKNPDVNPKWSFADYLKEEEIRTAKEFEKAKEYWDKLIPTMPLGPSLPLKAKPTDIIKPKFIRKQYFLSKEKWENIKQIAGRRGITAAMVLLTAYAVVLERWSETKEFCINVPFFNRDESNKEIENVVADFSTVLLVQVKDLYNNTFIENAEIIQKQMHMNAEYSAFSGIDVQRSMAKYHAGEKQIIPVVFSCNLGKPIFNDDMKRAFGELEFMISQTPQVWIDFQMFDSDGGVTLLWDYVEGLFHEDMIEDMFNAFCTEMDRISNESWWNCKIEVLPYKHLETRDKYVIEKREESKCIHESFFDIAESHTEYVAVIEAESGKTYTYASIAQNALKIANYLKDNGVKVGDAVGIMASRGAVQIEGILGILSAGAHYIPIASDLPHERIEVMLRKADAKYILKDRKTADTKWNEISELYIEDSKDYTGLNKPVIPDTNESAYIIYTSGSTGTPKGVEITHRQAWNTINCINEKFNVDHKDVILNVSSFSFDLSVYDIFGILSKGGTVISIDDSEWRNPSKWQEYILKYKVSIWNSVPVLLNMLIEQNSLYNKKMDSIRLVLLSGDWIRPEMIERARKIMINAQFVGLGGATEGSIWSNYFVIPKTIPESWESIPYGYPLENQKYRIIDVNGSDCPNHVAGELYIGGAGVAKGYVGEHELTKERFKFIDGERWYCTGDYGVFWNDGIIEFLGRRDQQVKILGHRIELLEVENVIKQINGIFNVVVSIEDNNKIVAYAIKENAESSLSREKVINYAKRKLPDYMVPQAVVWIDSIPLNSNGKIDRKQLKKIRDELKEEINDDETESVLNSKIEETLINIWKNILEVEYVKTADNYFSLGGDSLLATQLSVQIEKEFGISVSLEWIFTKPVLKEQADSIKALMDDNMKIFDKNIEEDIDMDLKNRYEPFPLSEIQQAYVLGATSSYALGGITTHYYFELDSKDLDVARLEKTFNKLIYRHDMMRAVVLKDLIHQKVLEKVDEYHIYLEDIRQKPLDNQQKILERIRNKAEHKKFEAGQWPAFDIRVTKSSFGARLHLCFDNTFYDGWSIFLIINEWQKLYNNEELPETTVLYRDYILYKEKVKKTDRYQADLEYWTNEIKDMQQGPDLPLIKDPMEIVSHNMTHAEALISSENWMKIKSKVRDYGITLASFLLGAYAEVLGKWSRHQKFTLNLTRFNRLPVHKDINNVVGDFTSLIMLPIDNTKGESFIERCLNIQRKLWESLEHPYVCGVEVQKLYAEEKSINENITMPVVFTSGFGLEINSDESDNTSFGKVTYNMSETPQVWLDHQVAEKKEGLVISWDYVDELFPDNMINDMFDSYKQLFNDLIEYDELWENISKCIAAYRMPDEVIKSNNTDKNVESSTILEKFIEQVKIRPKDIAVVYKDSRMTYEDLYMQAEQVKNNLLENGCRYQDVVGIYMNKGWEQLAGALGVLMCNAIFVPLDVDNPSERIQKIIKDAKINFILTKKEGAEARHFDGVRCLEVSHHQYENAQIEDIYNFSGEDIAYIIYTSGTTGIPKGVAISNDSVMNTIIDMNERFNVTDTDTVLSLSKFNFDLSIYDAFGMLTAGGTIVLPEASKITDTQEWIKLINEEQITVWNTVPAFMSMLVNSLKINKRILSSIRLVLLSGDWIPVELIEKIREYCNNPKIISLGGATEASIWSIYYEIGKIDSSWTSIPYGKPLANQKFYILNDLLEESPVNVTGKIYIAGRGLADCYWNEEKLTASRFIYNPKTKERIYETGDIGKYLPDGNIIFQGREDHQVKINGHRIEIGEIENAVNRVDGIKSSVTGLYENPELAGSRTLSSILVLEDKKSEITKEIQPVNMSREVVFPNLCSRYSADEYKEYDARLQSVVKETIISCIKQILNIVDISDTGLIRKKIKDEVKIEYRGLMDKWIDFIQAEEVNNYNLDKDLEAHNSSNIMINDLKKKLIESIPVIRDILIGKTYIAEAILNEKLVTPEELNNHNNRREAIEKMFNDSVQNVLKAHGDLDNVAILELANRVDFSNKNYSSTGNNIRYVYADDSGFYADKFKDNKEEFMELIKLDMNKSALEQGLNIGEFDIVLLNNTIHRAKNITKTLSYIQRVLKPGGYLVINEPFKMNELLLITTAIMENGYSQLEDERKIERNPFLSLHKWCEVFEKLEFEIAGSISFEDAECMKQGVIIARNMKNAYSLEEEKLKKVLELSLPNYMIPNKYIVVDDLPLSQNGKIDRKAANRILSAHLKGKRKLDKPETETETILLELWQKVLKCTELSVNDDFFSIGGDSLRAIQLVNSINDRFMININIKDIYVESSIKKMGTLISKCQSMKDDTEEGVL